MSNFQSYRRSAVRYWECRRIIYNAVLILPALVGYGFTDSFNWVGDPHRTHYAYIIPLFLVSAICANICYSFSYALEFLFGSDDPTSSWPQLGRSTVLTSGILLSIWLAFVGGGIIADMEWQYALQPG
jgi:hypothetical protein